MEIDYMNVEERYNMKKYYNLSFTEDEHKRAMDIRHKWYVWIGLKPRSFPLRRIRATAKNNTQSPTL